MPSQFVTVLKSFGPVIRSQVVSFLATPSGSGPWLNDGLLVRRENEVGRLYEKDVAD